MDALPWRAKLYLGALAVLALIVGAILVAQTPVPAPRQLGLATLLTMLLVVALSFPLHIAPKTKLSLHTSIIFATTLLFPPGIAVLIAAAGTVLSEVPRRQPPDQTLFNAAQLVLQVAICGTFLQLGGWSIGSITQFAQLLEIVVAAVIMTVLELVAVSGIISFQTDQPLVHVVRQIFNFDPVEWMTQYALGVVGAIVLTQHIWLLPLLLPPAILLYRSGQRQAQLHAQTELLEHQAFHDALTGLPNRALFLNRLQHALAAATRGGGQVGVLFLDLDGFKSVNDQLGHAAGDEVLRAVAHRLIPCLRPGDTVARFGGDEFVVLLDALPDVEAARQVAERIERGIRAPLMVQGHTLPLTTSIGVAVSHRDYNTPEALLHAADAALYDAKAHGKAGYVISEPKLPPVHLDRSRVYTNVPTGE